VVSKSPPNDSIVNCLFPLLTSMGIELTYETKHEGFFPIGNGRV
jgi:RNA 3'-terminal phosphate cyclase